MFRAILSPRWYASGPAAVLVLAFAANAVPAQSERPNVVVIFTDDQQFRAMGCSGNDAIRTPHLDSLAAHGMRFTTAFVATPVCVASRASIMSSRYPQQHGSTFLDNKPFIEKVRKGKLKTIAQYLGEVGYVTGYCGKSHLGDPKANLGFHEGRNHANLQDIGGFRFAEQFVAARAKDKKPFFLWVSPHQPHIPLKPPDKWRRLYKPEEIPLAPNFREKPLDISLTNQGKPGEITYRDGGGPKTREAAQRMIALYYAVISHMDAQIGGLLEQLARLELEQNTLVIFLSDNGYCLGNHGIGNKIVMYEESVRVPFLVRYPAAVQAGRVSDEMVTSLDVMPTILDFCGVPIPAGLEGKSLKPLLTGKETPLREEVFSECCGVAGLGIGHRMVRTRRWKYMLSDVNDEGLFDLKNDPYELKNLAADPAAAEQLRRLRKSLAAWMDHVKDGHARPPGG